MSWTFDKDYKNLAQVEQFWDAYSARLAELQAAGKYPYNEEFKGHIPGAEGPCEETAIYLLQKLRAARDLAKKVAEYREQGWRDLTAADAPETPKRFAGIAHYGYCVGGTGWEEWPGGRVARDVKGTLYVLPGRARTNGNLLHGSVLVKDA